MCHYFSFHLCFLYEDFYFQASLIPSAKPPAHGTRASGGTNFIKRNENFSSFEFAVIVFLPHPHPFRHKIHGISLFCSSPAFPYLALSSVKIVNF